MPGWVLMTVMLARLTGRPYAMGFSRGATAMEMLDGPMQGADRDLGKTAACAAEQGAVVLQKIPDVKALP